MHHIFLLSHSRVVCFVFFSFRYTQIYYVKKMFSRTRRSHDDAIRYHWIVGAIRFFFFLYISFFIGLFLFGVVCFTWPFRKHLGVNRVRRHFAHLLFVQEKVLIAKAERNKSSLFFFFRKFLFLWVSADGRGGSYLQVLTSFEPNVFIQPCVSLGD